MFDFFKLPFNAWHQSLPAKYLVGPIRAVPDHVAPDIVPCIATKDETRIRPVVFEPDFGITLLEFDFSRVESGPLDGLENLVLLPFLKLRGGRHNDLDSSLMKRERIQQLRGQ